MTLLLILTACTVVFLYLAWRERAKYLDESDESRIHGPALDEIGELLACPRMLGERDARYRARLQECVRATGKRDTVEP